MRTAAALLIVMLGARTIPGQIAAASPHPDDKAQPRTALDWFRRADELTNIRMPGSPSFHMKVAFHAYPGVDFAPQGKSPIVTGDGVYEEWWISTEKWRRQITFGTYRVVEVRADGIRKFQATSDYEPSRVLFLLQALLQPVPRYLLEPELEDPSDRRFYDFGNTKGWKVELRAAGTLAYVELERKDDSPKFGPNTVRWDLLASGLPVRAMSINCLTTTWQNQTLFGTKEVPRHVEIHALGRTIVAADAAVETLGQPDSALFRLGGELAEPGMTLRPLDEREVRFSGWATARVRYPAYPANGNYPDRVKTVVIAIVDRHGVPREPEVTGIEQEGQPLSDSQKDAVWAAAREVIATLPGARFKPAMIEGSPCEAIVAMQPFRSQSSVEIF